MSMTWRISNNILKIFDNIFIFREKIASELTKRKAESRRLFSQNSAVPPKHRDIICACSGNTHPCLQHEERVKRNRQKGNPVRKNRARRCWAKRKPGKKEPGKRALGKETQVYVAKKRTVAEVSLRHCGCLSECLPDRRYALNTPAETNRKAR